MFNYFLYRIGQCIASCLPLKAAYAVADILSDIRYFFAFEDNRNVKSNLRIIFPRKSVWELRNIRIRMNRNFARYLVDFFRFNELDGAYIEKYVQVENRHIFDQVLARGNGCILLTAHLGNWELGGVVLSLLGYPLWAVALPHKSKKVDAFFNFQRESKGLRVIPLGKAFIRCVNILKSNELIALVGDRDFTKDGGILVDFFGKPAYLPKGPAMISLMTGAPIVPAFMFRNSTRDGFTIRFEKPVVLNTGEKLSPKNGKYPRIRKVKVEEVKSLTESCARVMEEYIRSFPEQWYMFKKFWAE